MKYYYSVIENGFYIDSINSNIPEDAIEIDYELYKNLLKGQAEGRIISQDDKGELILTDPAPPTEQEIADIACKKRDELMEVAYRKIRLLDSKVKLANYDDSQDDTPLKIELTAWERYLIALSEIEQQPNFPDQIDWPQMPSDATTI